MRFGGPSAIFNFAFKKIGLTLNIARVKKDKKKNGKGSFHLVEFNKTKFNRSMDNRVHMTI